MFHDLLVAGLVAIVAVALVGGALYLLRAGAHAIRRGTARLWGGSTPIAEAESIAAELGPSPSVPLEGTVEPVDGAIETPFADLPAVATSYEVERRSGRPGSSGKRVHAGAEAVPLVLDDGTGRILVEPGGAATDLGREATVDVPAHEATPDRIGSALEGMEVARESRHPRRFAERRLVPGDRAYVEGPVALDPDATDAEGVTAVVRADAGAGRLLVSSGSRRVTGYRTLVRGLATVAVAACTLGIAGGLVYLVGGLGGG